MRTTSPTHKNQSEPLLRAQCSVKIQNPVAAWSPSRNDTRKNSTTLQPAAVPAPPVSESSIYLSHATARIAPRMNSHTIQAPRLLIAAIVQLARFARCSDHLNGSGELVQSAIQGRGFTEERGSFTGLVRDGGPCSLNLSGG